MPQGVRSGGLGLSFTRLGRLAFDQMDRVICCGRELLARQRFGRRRWSYEGNVLEAEGLVVIRLFPHDATHPSAEKELGGLLGLLQRHC